MPNYVLPIVSVILSLAAAAPALADADKGATVFKKCKSCHQIGPDAKHMTGPHLNGIAGRKAGSAEGYTYGADLAAAGEKGLIWTEALIAEYIADPKEFLKAYLDKGSAKSKMSFKLKKEKDRLDVAAYLAALGTDEETAAEEATPAAPAKSVEEVIAEQAFTEEFLASEEEFERGKEIWFAQCTHCHGYKAYPGKAPKLKPAKYKPEFVFKRVYKGFRKMPSWKDTYSIDEIRAVVAYVKSSKFSP